MSKTAGLDAVEESLRRRFRVATTAASVGGRDLSLLHPESAEDLIDASDFERDERLPYWAELWPSARILAERLLAERGDGRRLLELGCGTGLVSVCATLAGFDVTSSDYYEDALRFTKVNVARNGGPPPITRLLDWRHLPHDLPRFDVVAASDVLYERPYGALVARVIDAALEPHGVAIVADPGRVGRDAFVQTIGTLGWNIVRRTDCPYEDGRVRQTIAVYEIARRAS